jgi:hypothetical protein
VVRAAGVQSEVELVFAGVHQSCAPLLGGLDRLPDPQRVALGTAFGLSSGPVREAFAERARHELQAPGEYVRRRTFEALVKLTAQETDRPAGPRRQHQYRIVSRLFISPRTVGWHLRNVFTKLDVTSRKELRHALPRPADAPGIGDRPRG